MRKTWLLVAILAATGCFAQLFGQVEAPRTRLYFGPFLGASTIVVSAADFDTTMQAVYSDSGRDYYPFFTQMGVSALQVVPTGQGANSITFHELFSLGGLDQNMPIPALDLVLGFQFGGGVEVGLGPHFSVLAPEGSVKIVASVAYALGWTIARPNFSLPVLLMVVPSPSYAHPQISVLVGFAFESME